MFKLINEISVILKHNNIHVKPEQVASIYAVKSFAVATAY